MNSTKRILSVFLAVIILLSTALPVSAQEIEAMQDIFDVSDGGNYIESVSAPENTDNTETSTETEQEQSDSGSDFDLSYEDEPDDEEKNTTAEEPEQPDNDSESDTPVKDEPVEEVADNLSLGLSEQGIQDEAALLAAMEAWISSLRLDEPVATSGITTFALPGDSGSITHTTIPIRPYDVNVPGVGRAYGSVVWRMKIKGEDAFCLQIWKLAGGTYTAGNATSGNGATAQYIANYMALSPSARTNAYYVAAQVLVWESLYGNIGIYSQSIQGTSFESAYHALKNASADASDLLYWTSSTGGQEIVTFATGEPPIIEDGGGEEEEEEEGDEVPPTETVTVTNTRTEVRGSTTFEYSDAIGQITIAKRDNEGVSLDGAIFNIHVQFANGQTGGDSAFEVYNGSRLFTYTHPANDHAPAVVTVTEVRAPDKYIGDPTPKTATVHPTYTRVTKVTTTTITITTTTTTTTNIETGDVLAEVTQEAETELDPPMVQEYVDFVEGDRETTLTFINTPKPCSLTIYKYSKGNYSQALSGAKFRIRYADPSVSAQVWERSTGADGKIVIDPLPYDGTLVIEELEAPANHVIGPVSSWTVTVAKGEDKRVDISNDKKADIIAYKKDAQTGQLLAGAIIKATLLRSHTEPYEQNVSYTQTTDADGKAVFSNVIPGEYRLEEQAPPQYFLGTDVVYNVSVFDGSNEPVSVTFTNEPWTGLTIRKVDATNGKGLANAIFKLYEGTAAETTKFLGDFQTNENGIVVIQNLESEKYYTILESQPPYGFFLDADNNVQTVLIKPEAIEKNLTVIFRNMPKPKLLITKIDEATGNKLPGAVFRVAQRGSAEFVDATTGADGTVLLDNLNEEWYQISEIRSPSGFLNDSTVHDIELIAGETAKLVVNNSRAPSLTIKKIDADTGEALAGAVFRVTKQGAMEYQDVTTGANGIAVIKGLTPGWVTVVEQKSANTHILDQTPHHIELLPAEDAEIIIQNKRKPSLTILKIDNVTKQPLQYAKFSIAIKNGKNLGEYVTDADGKIVIDGIEPSLIEIRELVAPDGYNILDGTKEILIEAGKDVVIEIPNQPINPLIIKKVDADTGEPLSGAVFTVTKINGEFVGEYKTGRNGFITVTGLEPSWLSVFESKAPSGYLINSASKQVELKMNQPAIVEFENSKLKGLQIKKTDADTGEPLSGAYFRVTTTTGELVGEYITDNDGFISIPELAPNSYQIFETRCPVGYQLDSTPKTVVLKTDSDALVEFTNKRLPGLQVRKVNANTGEPLAGAKFRVQKMNGEYIGDYVTNNAGFFVVPDLESGWLTVFETQACAGFVTDSTPQNVELKPNKTAILEFSNKPLAGLQIKKVDDVTGLPMAGVEFSIAELDGRRVGTFTTDDTGLLFVPDLKEGWLIVTETKTLPNYKLDNAPRNVEIKADRLNTVEYRNKPYPFLQIKKIDAENGKPIAGVKFKVYDKNSRELGEFTTNDLGIVKLTGMEAGTYFVRESVEKEGYIKDESVKEVSVFWGKTTEITVKNVPMATLRLKKVDSVTGETLMGATFILYNAKNNIVGEYTTDENGLIVFPRSLPAGQFKLKEIVAPKDHVLLDKPITIDLKSGETREIVIPNDPVRGKIQIVKKSADDNTITKQKAGAVLAGAVFEVVNEKLEVVDTITTDARGIAITKDLPLGRFAIREIVAPSFFVLDDRVFYAEIKLHDDIVRFEVLNTSCDISVTVEKRGNVEALTGDLIRYDFSNISNTSNISLDEFYLHDKLPTDAVRLEKLVTGTWSERLKYKVVYRTNLKTEYRTWKDGLLTTVNNELDVSTLKLAANEYVTDFKLEFGTVEAGFHEQDAPYILTRVLEDLPHEYRFVNNADVGGKCGKEFVYNVDSWVCISFSVPRGSLPRTGLNFVEVSIFDTMLSENSHKRRKYERENSGNYARI